MRQYGYFQGIKTFKPQPRHSNVWHSYNPRVGRAIPFNEMTRTQQRHFQRNYGQMMRQKQGVEHSKTMRESKVMSKNVPEDKEEEDIEEIMKESIEKECVEKLRFEHIKKMKMRMIMGK
ncbi:Adenylate cyclase [Abeliophyllum distichum]|uniref:Adenylate cyclase n=1 Tax=Abeliophyllum distichum TaxID=126358 RepID=A0ABD1PCL6_9LAMI